MSKEIRSLKNQLQKATKSSQDIDELKRQFSKEKDAQESALLRLHAEINEKEEHIELLKALNNEQEASLSALKEIQQAETPKRKGRDTVSTENPTPEEKTQSAPEEEKPSTPKEDALEASSSLDTRDQSAHDPPSPAANRAYTNEDPVINNITAIEQTPPDKRKPHISIKLTKPVEESSLNSL